MVPVAAAEPSPPRIEYSFEREATTVNDHRELSTQVSLTNGYANYSYREQVFGAITPAVRSISFSTRYDQHKASAAESERLVSALLKAGVLELASDNTPGRSHVYFSTLDVQLNGRSLHFVFFTPPRSPKRKAVHQIILGFAHQSGIDRIPAEALTVSEGDRQPARRVQLAEVLAHPTTYQGKRISVVGYYLTEMEWSSLGVDKASALSVGNKNSVWRGGSSSFADIGAIQDSNNAWLRVDGVFFRGPGGHMGLWPGELVRLTRIEPVAAPK